MNCKWSKRNRSVRPLSVFFLSAPSSGFQSSPLQGGEGGLRLGGGGERKKS